MLIVEFFAGPGSGKTTIASGCWSYYKAEGYVCEFVREYAQELIFSGRRHLLSEQIIVNAGQLERYANLRLNNCPLAFADSSAKLGRIYDREPEPARLLGSLIDHYYDTKLRTIKVFVHRTKQYTSFGRGSSEQLARRRDREIYETFGPYDFECTGEQQGLQDLLRELTPRLIDEGVLLKNEDWSTHGTTEKQKRDTEADTP
jgi:hypothetical protein